MENGYAKIELGSGQSDVERDQNLEMCRVEECRAILAIVLCSPRN